MVEPEFQIPWRLPWEPTPSCGALWDGLELHWEVCAGHVLYRKKVKRLGRRVDCDDVLFRILDGSEQLAVVHLTYQRERDPRWPATGIYASLQDWLENGMLPDATDYGRDADAGSSDSAAG